MSKSIPIYKPYLPLYFGAAFIDCSVMFFVLTVFYYENNSVQIGT